MIELINIYFSWQLTLAGASVLLACLRLISSRWLSAQALLRIHLCTFSLACLAPIASSHYSPWSSWAPAPLQIALNSESQPALKWIRALPTPDPQTELGNLTTAGPSLSLRAALWALSGGLFLWFVFVIALNTKHFIQVFKTLRSTWPMRKIGRVEILCSERISSPCAFRIWRRALILIPQSLIADPDVRIIIGHELQHHRQHDTTWLFALIFCRQMSFWNPFAVWLCKGISEQQELACDEVLLCQKRFSPPAYAHLLVRVAEQTLQKQKQPICAMGMSLSLQGSQLKRRINLMFQTKLPLGSTLARAITGLASIAMVATLALAAHGAKAVVNDQRLSLADAETLAVKMQVNTDFPIVVNEPVLKWLNWFVATNEGRRTIRKALLRKQGYESLLQRKLNEYSAPEELAALPIIESGYNNQARSPGGWSAGLWQFIVGTAEQFGLQVNKEIDERLVPHLATDAAIRYLLTNHLRFRNWHLSILAYTHGERAVYEAMKRTGYKTAWELVLNGAITDVDYLPKFMAGLIIMKNPELIAGH